ncbi:MAG: hypothetical protein AB7F32_04260 [Victivallaceae bacterium]
MKGNYEIILLLLIAGLGLGAFWAGRRIKAKVALMDGKYLVPAAILLGALIIAAAILAKSSPRYQPVWTGSQVRLWDNRTETVVDPSPPPPIVRTIRLPR